MKLSKSDFPVLRTGIMAMCVSSLVSIALLYASNEYANKANRELQSARNMSIDAHRRLASAHEDRENMSIYADEYGLLIKNKIIGDDQRLDWIEGLEDIRQMNLVTGFRYHIAPQQNYDPKPPLGTGNFDIHYSEAKFQLDLLHEAQLVDFFTALRNRIKGWYHLEGCSVQRSSTDEGGTGKTSAIQLKAECTGGWITLKNRNTQP